MTISGPLPHPAFYVGVYQHVSSSDLQISNTLFSLTILIMRFNLAKDKWFSFRCHFHNIFNCCVVVLFFLALFKVEWWDCFIFSMIVLHCWWHCYAASLFSCATFVIIAVAYFSYFWYDDAILTKLELLFLSHFFDTLHPHTAPIPLKYHVVMFDDAVCSVWVWAMLTPILRWYQVVWCIWRV